FDHRIDTYRQSDAFGYRIHHLPLQPLGPLRLYRRQRREFERLMNRLRPDVLHGQGVDVRGFVAVRSGYPSVVTVHGLLGEDAKYQRHWRKRWRAKLASYRIERRTVAAA